MTRDRLPNLLLFACFAVGTLPTALACSESPDPADEVESPAPPALSTLERAPDAGVQGTPQPEQGSPTRHAEPLEPLEPLASALAARLSRVGPEASTRAAILELVQEGMPLTVQLELPMWGKEFRMLETGVESLEGLLECLDLRHDVLPGHCEYNELLAHVGQYQGISEAQPRSCTDRCCRFGYELPAEGTLALRRVCFDDVDDRGRLRVTDLTLGVE